jgi:hypothetical protein
MVPDTQDNWVFGLCPPSGILKNTTFKTPDLFPPSGLLVSELKYKDCMTTSILCVHFIIHVVRILYVDLVWFLT